MSLRPPYHSIPPPLPSKWCITCDTHATLKQQQGHSPWLSRAQGAKAYPSQGPWLSCGFLAVHRAARRLLHQLIFLCGGSVFKWAFG